MIKIMSLDTSTKSTGWAIFQNEHFYKSGHIDLRKKNMSAPDRIDLMIRTILDVLNKERPDVIIVEKVSVSRNMNTVRELCRVIDSCYLYALQNGCRFFEVTPSEWRGAIGMQRKSGDRNTYKQMSMQFAEETFTTKKIMDDEADAICIGAAYVNEYIAINKYRFETKE